MDSWMYMSEGKGIYLSEEFNFQYDNHGYNKSKLVGCEFKPLVNVESYPLVSNTQALERLDFMDMGFSNEIRKSCSVSSDPSEDVFSDEISTIYGNVASPSFGEEKDCGSNIIPTDSMRSNNKDSSFVDLKLGRLGDGGVGRDGEFTEANLPGSFVGSSPRVKRSRLTSSILQSPRCQVLGCHKDLGSYKGYYKRHKVCEEHTRTARVTVNGMEQRFCQQCSRFHQLAEFDGHKRSCRKRLAVHNKRRRKPQLPSEPGTGVIIFSSSYACTEALPTATTGLSKLEEWKWAEHVKVEDSVESSDIFFHTSGVAENTKDTSADVKDNIMSTSISTILNSSNVRQAGPALSLLSAQSRNHTDLGHAHNDSQDAFKDMVQNGFYETGMYLMEAGKVDHTLSAHSDCNTVDLLFPGDDISRESDTRNAPLGHGIILDLLQLSSRLQRIDQQKLLTESEAR